MTVADLLNIKNTTKIALPAVYKYQLAKMIKSFAVVLTVVLGVDSPLYLMYKHALVDNYDYIHTHMEALVALDPGGLLYAKVLC